MGVIRDLKKTNINLGKSHNPNHSKNDSSMTDSVPTILSVFQPIYHTTDSNQVCLLSDNLRKNLYACFSNANCCASVFDNIFDQDSTK